MSRRGYLFTLVLVICAVLLFQIIFNPDKSPLLDWWYKVWRWP